MRLREGKNPIASYLSPRNEEFSHFFFKNLIRKHNAWCQHEDLPLFSGTSDGFTLQILSPEKMKSCMFKKGSEKQSKVIGYEFRFGLNAPVELIKTGYYAGFGEKNSMGFGCVEIKRQLNNLLAPGEAGIDSVEKNKKYKQNETNLQND
jgi:CRISPR-associated endoribonuclease Cas6